MTEKQKPKSFDATFMASTGERRRRMVDHVPERIGKYLIRGELGRGAGGIVYRSHDPFVRRDVAVKIARHQGDGSIAPEDTEEGKAFFAEARAAGMLQHPNIVSLFDAGAEGDLFYLVMEYIDGTTLLPLCNPHAPRPPVDRVLEIIFKCANALDYSHSRGILHRDIKPSNIMLNAAGVPKIMDFSIAEINTDTQSGFALSQSLLGSPLYMSPEQVRMEPLTPAADLYSLGVVMYQMLTGAPLFRARDLRALFQQIEHSPSPKVEDTRVDVSPEVCAVVTRLLQKRARDRYQAGKDLAGELARLFDQLRLHERQQARRDNSNSLRRLRFFDRFSDAEIEEVLNASNLTHHAAGAVIAQEGEIDNAFYIIVLGSAEVRRMGRSLHRLEKGDCYGEAGLLSTQRNTCSVIADSKVLALKVSGTRLEQRSEGCQLRFYKTFLESMIYRLSMTSAKVGAAG
ncbi:MAG TPA: serine/threonine-protein kinase [Verrucomicrobiae bacterium]|nr:serine/threonine-protein kinase [Verrucomicrobiae bacterium]